MLNHGIGSHESYPQHSEMSHYLNHGSSRNCEASKLHEIYGLSQELERYEKLHHTHLLLSINFTVINLIIGKAQPSFEKRVLHISQQKRFFLQVSCTVYEIHNYHIQQFFFCKIGSHSTIYTFKNYFTTVFSIFSNKRYQNRPLVFHLSGLS